MQSHFLSAILLALASSAWSITFIPAQSDTFPQCGTQCAELLSSQQTCAGIAAPLDAENCFCQQQEIQLIYLGPDTTCTGQCSTPADRSLVQNWFFGFCQQVGSGKDPLAGQQQPTTPPTDTNTDTGSGTGTGTTTPAPTPAAPRPGGSSINTETGSTWFKHHWQWILMVVILAIGFLSLGFFARWYKKRHDLKTVEKAGYATKGDSTRLANMLKVPSEKVDSGRNTATPDLWGPHQHMAATRDHQYDMERGVSPISTMARDSPYHSNTDRSAKPGRQGRTEVYDVTDQISSAYPNQQQGGYGRF